METTRWNRLEYKQTGKAAFLANYWPMVGGILLLLLLMGDFLPTRIHETVSQFVKTLRFTAPWSFCIP